ncbi:MAG: hypothetical protein RSA20_05510 [Oscillospiraceae bacterium]
MRITTSTMMRQYKGRLNNVMRSMDVAGTRVTTGRKYQKASEDPSSAVRSYTTRREFLKNDDSVRNLKDTQELFTSYESSMMQVSKMTEDAHVDILTAINGTQSVDERKILANKLREMQKTMVMDMNVTVSDQYIFGGSGNKKPPFALDDKGVLTYRGIDVNTKDPDELKTLQKMSEEQIFVDLGFGMTTGAGGTIDQNSAFNKAIPGIKFLGFGNDADGASKNLVTLMGQIANALDQPDGVYNMERVEKLNTKFDQQRNGVIIDITKMGSNTMFLNYTEKRLDEVDYNFTKSIDSLEFVDSAKAITEFKMQDYIYRATLQMGMNILSPSFIDFMK